MPTTDPEKSKFSLPVFREILKSSGRITRLIWHEQKGFVILFTLTLLAVSSAPFLSSGSRGLLINGLLKDTAGGAISLSTIWALAFLVGASVLYPIASSLQFYFERQFWFLLEERFESMLLAKKADMDIAIHENPQYNDLFHRVGETGMWRMQNFANRQLFIVQNILEVIIAGVILSFANWWIVLVLFLGSIPELIVEARYGQYTWGLWTGKAEIRRRYWDLRQHFEHSESLTELKIFQNARYFVKLAMDLFHEARLEQTKIEKTRLRRQIVGIIISQLAIAGTIIWFVIRAVHGAFQIGTFTFFLASIGELRTSFSSLFRNLGQQYQDGLFVRDMFKLLDIPPVLKKPTPGIKLVKDKTPTIIFDNVSFNYPEVDGVVLKNFSLTIPAGEKLAIVGSNGAGKTTLIKLLCRFYDPTEGRILIDGYDLKEIDLESWYHLLGVLFQDYSNYHFLVKEAIGIGRTSHKLDEPKVKLSARASESHLFIEDWEKQYGQMLGKHFTGGVEPSIGQWQKLALARTFYRDPRILILDEPTSSVDAESEAKIFAKLEKLPKDRTVILISHRFSTVRQANQIVVLENGALSEQGTHRELVKLGGTYARLFKLQAKGYQ